MSRSRSPPPPPRRGQNDRNRDFGRSDRDRERNGGGRRREDDRDKMDVDSPPRRYRDDDGPSRGGRPELKIKGRANAEKRTSHDDEQRYGHHEKSDDEDDVSARDTIDVLLQTHHCYRIRRETNWPAVKANSRKRP